MKKILLTAVCTIFVLTASAQLPVKFGVRAGMNVAKMTEGVDDDENPKSRVSYHVGVIVDIPVFKEYLYIQPGLYFTQKGYKFKEQSFWDDEEESWKTSMNPTYMEIPILISGRYNINSNVQLQVSFGPYLAVGLGGKFKDTEREGPYKYEDTYKIFKKERDDDYSDKDDDEGLGYKRFDAGLSFGAGVLLKKHYFIGFQYELGLVNIKPSDWKKWWGESAQNRNFMLSVGYNF